MLNKYRIAKTLTNPTGFYWYATASSLENNNTLSRVAEARPALDQLNKDLAFHQALHWLLDKLHMGTLSQASARPNAQRQQEVRRLTP